MKSYSLTDTAYLLGTTYETVRRWIEDKKLVATKTSNKTGYVIKKDSLFEFLVKYPKYLTHVEERDSELSFQAYVYVLKNGLKDEFLGLEFASAGEIKRYLKKYTAELKGKINDEKRQIVELRKDIDVNQSRLASIEKILSTM